MFRRSALQVVEIERPVLDLSGEGLRAILRIMIAGSEDHGGIECYVDAVKLKSTMFQQALAGDAINDLELETFKGLCTFMATVRRRIGNWLSEDAFADMREGIIELLADDDNVDARINGQRYCTTPTRNASR
jgi:hypothetical protein